MDVYAAILAARRVSTPIIAVNTPDNQAFISQLGKRLVDEAAAGAEQEPAIIQWDISVGCKGLNAPGVRACKGGAMPEAEEMLQWAVSALPPCTCLVMQNVHLIFELTQDNQRARQAVCNVRQPFKSDGRTLILLAPSVTLPVELQQDVLLLDEGLPDEAQLADIVSITVSNAGLEQQPDTVVSQAVAALAGLAAFPAEQAVAMSLKKTGLQIAPLWERKRMMVRQTPGLEIYQEQITFDDCIGVDALVTDLRQLLEGEGDYRAIVFMDEIEKMIGSELDTSGVSKSLQEAFLAWTSNTRPKPDGIILLGPAGTGKSHVAKAAGNEKGVPTIGMSFSSMKASLVGESEARIANALKVIDAVSQKRVLMIATCNSIGALTPEIRRRFGEGTYFVDLPSRAGREKLWRYFTKQFELPDQEIPNSEGWTGAEIEVCCKRSRQRRMTLVDSAKRIVPVSHSAADVINRLREEANDKFLSAQYEGNYQFRSATEMAQLDRKIKLT